MRTVTKILAGVVVVTAAGWFAGCNSAIDDADTNVVLLVENLTIPPVTAQLDQNLGACTFTLTNATATFKNKPKNSQATTSPFNDINLLSVDVEYFWDDGIASPADYPHGLFGVGGSVPAQGSASAQFGVANANDLPSRTGHTATLALTFHGKTVAGDEVSVTTGGTLQVNSCSQENVGACCFTGICSIQTVTDCVTSGGVYAGDNSTCATTICP